MVEAAVGSAAIVVVEPAGECPGALVRAAVDGPVGPSAQERADEAFGLPIGAWPVWARAQVAEADKGPEILAFGMKVCRYSAH